MANNNPTMMKISAHTTKDISKPETILKGKHYNVGTSQSNLCKFKDKGHIFNALNKVPKRSHARMFMPSLILIAKNQQQIKNPNRRRMNEPIMVQKLKNPCWAEEIRKKNKDIYIESYHFYKVQEIISGTGA